MLRSFDGSEKKSWDIGEIEVALNLFFATLK